MRPTTSSHTFFLRRGPAPALALALAALALGPGPTRADAPPPEQTLATDPGRPLPRLGISANGIGIALGDYALRVEATPDPWHAVVLSLGASRRHGGDALLVELGWTVWPMATGLDGFFVHAAAGLAWAGPWNGGATGARSVLRFGGELGWQFLWEDLSFTLGAGATGFVELDGGAAQGAVWAEPHGRVALGFVLR